MTTAKTSYKVDTRRRTIKEKIQKIEQVKKEIKNYKTLALIDLRKLPDSLLQYIRKKIREEEGKVFILKKAVIERVLKSDKKLVDIAGECDKPVALILTNSSPFELNKFFKENKKKRAAKPGEIAPFEIVIPEGETDLPPGPALSELKGAGINVQIKGGRIFVARDSVVAKSGETLSGLKVKALQKLNIMPFEVAVRLIIGYDREYVYGSELLNMSETVNGELKDSLRHAFNLSINASYPTELNVDQLLSKAYLDSINLAINGELYSSSSIEQILGKAYREGLPLSSAKSEEKNQ